MSTTINKQDMIDIMALVAMHALISRNDNAAMSPDPRVTAVQAYQFAKSMVEEREYLIDNSAPNRWKKS